MALFLLLIILLAIAWGLADYQLQSPIERQPPPVTAPKPAPVAPAAAEILVPLAEVAADTPSTTAADAVPGSEPDAAADDRPAAPPVSGPAPE